VVVGPSEGLLGDGVVDRGLPAHELITGEGGSSLGELKLRVLPPPVERRAVHAQPPGKSHFRRRVTFLRRQGHPGHVLALVVVDLWGVSYHIHSVLALPLVWVYLYVYPDNARYTEGVLYSLQKW
jgi:hypothetical protein